MGKLGFSKKAKTPVDALMSVTTAGTPERLGGYYTAITIAFNDLAPATITDSASLFLSKMIKAGTKIKITGSIGNDGIYEVDTVVAGTITLKAGEVLADEIAGATVIIEPLARIFCKTLTIQSLEANTSNVAIGSSNIDLSTGLGTVLAPLNTDTEEGAYLDDFYVDVGVNGEGVSVKYEEVKTPYN